MKRKYVNPSPDHDYDTARMESIRPRTGDYSTWTEHELRLEISRRQLTASQVSLGLLSDSAERKARLVEILEGNDALSSELKKIAVRYIGRVVTCDDKETKP